MSTCQLGRWNELTVRSINTRGAMLDAGTKPIFIARNELPAHLREGEKLRVFVYHNSQQEWLATRSKPKISVGRIACLRVADVNRNGAFLDWGLAKQLFVPYAEQVKPMRAGEYYLVACYLDKAGRITASSKLNKFLQVDGSPYKNGDKVTIIAADKTDLGNKVVVEDKYWGLIHRQDQSHPLRYGKKYQAIIKKVRDDGRLDIVLAGAGSSPDQALSDKILQHMREQGGISLFHDKSSPAAIYDAFGVSKKVFKAALGQLYKEKKIIIEPDSIRLTE